MKIIIDEVSEEPTEWKLTGQKLPDNCIQLTIGNHEDLANIVVDQNELIKMINILVEMRNG